MSLSPEQVEHMRYTVERMLRGMKGPTKVWNLELTTIKPLEKGGFEVIGVFTEDFAGVVKKKFKAVFGSDLKIQSVTLLEESEE